MVVSLWWNLNLASIFLNFCGQYCHFEGAVVLYLPKITVPTDFLIKLLSFAPFFNYDEELCLLQIQAIAI